MRKNTFFRCSKGFALTLLLSLLPAVALGQTSPEAGASARGPRIVTMDNAFEEHKIRIGYLRERIAEVYPDLLELFDQTNEAFADYVRAECSTFIPEFFSGGSLRIHNARLCERDAYFNRMRILCPTYNPFLGISGSDSRERFGGSRERYCTVQEQAPNTQERGDQPN